MPDTRDVTIRIIGSPTGKPPDFTQFAAQLAESLRPVTAQYAAIVEGLQPFLRQVGGLTTIAEQMGGLAIMPPQKADNLMTAVGAWAEVQSATMRPALQAIGAWAASHEFVVDEDEDGADDDVSR